MTRRQSEIEAWARYADLRNLAFRHSLQAVNQISAELTGEQVFAAMMEFILSNVNVTLYCLSTGDASLYTSSGFGIIGGFAYDHVRSASRAFVKICHDCSSDMTLVDAFPGPRAGYLRFYALREGHAMMSQASEKLVAGKFIELRNAGHNVITELRNISSTAHSLR